MDHETEPVRIHTDYIRLQDLLKLSGAAETGGAAKAAVQAGGVLVNGTPCTQRGRKLRPGDTASWQKRTFRVVRQEPRTTEPE